MSDNDTSSNESETQPLETPTTEMVTQGSGETPETTTEKTSQQSVEDLSKELESLRTALKKANAESAKHRHASKELEDLKARSEAEKLSEKERLEKQLADLQSQHANATRQSQERIINYEVRLQAAQMGIVDPDAAAKLLDWSEIEYDDESGAPTNVQDLLNALTKSKPYLLKTPTSRPATSGGATNPSRSTTTASKEISWEMIAQLTPAEYAARSKDIQAWMAKNSRR